MDKQNDITAFKRLLGYVWPQWPRVLAVIFWSFLIALMFTISFMTILPLLKVMMNEEGLHSWVDRKVVQWRYGLQIPAPDYSVENKTDFYAIRIIKVQKETLAAQAKFHPFDRIISIDSESQEATVPYTKLIEQLAGTVATDDKQVMRIGYMRLEEGEQKFHQVELTIARNDLAQGQPLMKRLAWGGKWTASQAARWAVGYVPRQEGRSNKAEAVILIILGMGIVTLLRCTARFYQTYLAEKVVLISITNLRQDIFSHAMHMPVGFFSSQGTSDTISRIMTDVDQSRKGIKVLLGKTLREPLKGIGTLTAAMYLNWQLTLIFIGAAPITIALFAILGRKMKKATKKSLRSSAAMLGRLQEAINALRVVKVYNRQQYEIDRYKDTNLTLCKRLLRVSKIDVTTNPLMEVLGMLAGSAAMIVGAIWVSKERIEGSEFLTLLVMLGTSAESIRKVSDVWNYVQQGNAAAERLFSIIDQPAEKQAPDAFALKPLEQSIEFQDISFSYPGSETPVLDGLNLSVQAGQTVAVVGPNGSGKSTLVNLIPRFYDPDRGQILIDGQDIHRATLASLRSQISMVTQNVITFNDTVANNIAYGKLDAGMDEIIAAASQAFAHEFIEPLPDGYETYIGENSAGFSGGQLQRIVIARAILKNPQILIFDEAMSQIDADSEMKIHNALSKLMEGRTCFLIAHRFSTVISADSIIVIDQGRIVAQGKHDELIASSDVYRRLYETQLLGRNG